MSEFLELLPPADALQTLLDALSVQTQGEEVASERALGRVTREPIRAPFSLPAFSRSTVDGYAVRAADTFGASDSLPVYLKMVGEILMGEPAQVAIGPASCALIHTGGMLPSSADAVVMVEHTQPARPAEIEVQRAVAPGDNILHVGEDVSAGEVVIEAGVRLRPAEIGGLMALGIEKLMVGRRPRIGIISSGDEVVPVGASLEPGQVFDVNTHTLSSLIELAGGAPRSFGIIPDQEEALARAAAEALASSEALVLTAGSSVSTRDLTAQIIDGLGEPGVLVHGVNVRPGKPTILGLCQEKPVIGLPGNPVSALVIARLFVLPVVEALQGLRAKRPPAAVPARLALNLSSVAGREDWIPVRLEFDEDGALAEPVFGKSNLIFTLARADGLVCIPADATGLEAGERVMVRLL